MAQLFGPEADISGMVQHLSQLMAQEGLPFNADRPMTYNSRLAQELAKWGDGRAESDGLHMALYQAYFVDGKNIGDIAVLLQIVAAVGLPVAEAREILQQRTMKTAVAADWHHAHSVGVRSVPTFAVGNVGVVGAQPYEQLVGLMEHVGVPKRPASG